MGMKDDRKFLRNQVANKGLKREWKSWKDGWLGSACGEYICDMKGGGVLAGDKLLAVAM